jgi:hypothetical protein
MNLNHDSELRSQPLDSGPQNSLFFGLRIAGLGTRRMVRYSVTQIVAAGIIVPTYGNLQRRPFPSQDHECRVDGDPRHPSSEAGSAFEVAHVNKRSQQRVLNRVFGILTGSRYAMSSTKKLLFVLVGKRGEGR